MNLLKSLGAFLNPKKKRRGQTSIASAWRRLYIEELEPRNLPSLVAAFNFNEGSGNVLYDLSGNGNNGSITNAAWSTAGRFGDALSFSGNANSLVTVANSPSLELTSGMTLEAWVNPTSLSSLDNGWSSVISKEDVGAGSTPTSYALDAAIGNSAPPGVDALIHGSDQGPHAATPLVPGQWAFLAATYNGTTLQFYVNGNLEGSETISGGLTSTASPLTIGGDWAGAMFNGLIDNVRIYNTPLSQAAIQTDMHTPVTSSSLTLIPTTLASAKADSPYSTTLMAVGGSGAYTFAVTAGQLPSWLTLNGSTGRLSGIPTATGTSNFSITATDKHGASLNGTQAYTLTVNAASRLTMNPEVLANATANSEYSAALVATGGSGTYTFAVSAGSLPSWLTLNESTGVLAGTPTTTGTSTFTITASDPNNAGLTGSMTYTLTVKDASHLTVSPATLPSATANSPFSVPLSASGGSGAYKFVVSAGGLPSGLTLNGSTGVLSGTPTTAGTSNFTITAVDKNNILDGSKTYLLTVNAANSLTVTPAVLSNATFSSVYSAALGATGGSGAYTFAVTAGQLPSGLTLSGTTGVLSGTPTTTGTSNFTITATDKKNNTLHGSHAYTLTVSLDLNPATLANATANSAYRDALVATGGSGTYTFTISAGSLPSWLTLNNGVLSGTPTTTGTYSFTITASDTGHAGLSGSRAYTLTVGNASRLKVSPATLANATANGAYSATFTATGGSGAYSFIVTAGRLPSGLTLNASTGVLSGTPTTTGTSNFTITASDKHVAALQGSQTYALTVNAASSLTVSPAVLENATYDSVYSAALSATGGSGAYTFAVTAGQLPSGLTLSGSTGVLSGTPTATGSFTFTITATDNNITSLHGSHAYTLTVDLNLSPGLLANATANSAYTAPLSVAGSSGTETFAVTGGSLPSWLTLNTNTGVLSGTPTATGSSTFTITDPSSTGLSGSHTYTLTVNAASHLTLSPATLTSATANSAYSATLSATGGSGAYSFVVTAGRLPSGLTLNANTGAVTGTPTTSGTSAFTVTATDKDNAILLGNQAYTLTVHPASGLTVSPTVLATATFNSVYSAALIATGGSGAYTFAVTVGHLPSGLTLNGSTGVISGTPTTTGTSSFTITATDKNNATQQGSHAFTLTVDLKLTPGVLANASANSPYSAVLNATGGSGTYTFTVSAGSLPSWLTLNGSTGVLSGTPTTTGTSNFTITASDAHNAGTSASKAYTLTVSPATSLMVSSARLASATANSPYSAPLSAFGGSGAYTFAVTAGHLPSWLTLNRTTGVLSGTPTATGSSSFTITATDSKSTTLQGSRAYTLTVNAATSLTVSPAVLANATANSAYTATLSATGGSGTYTFAVSAGSLPTWLSLNANTGVLSGMPTTVGTSTFTITVTDSNRAHMTGSETYTLTVVAASSLTVSPTTLAHATANSFYSEAVDATGGSGTYTFAVSAGSLPSWLSLNTGTGVLTGTPTTAGTSTFTITATDSSVPALTGNKNYTLTVNPSSSLTLSPGTLANGSESGPYSATLNATGGSGTYSFVVSAGNLPAGVTLNTNTGVLGGIPTASGTFNFTITATDTNITTLHGTKSYTLTVTNTAPTATLVAPTTVNEGSAFTVALTNPSDVSSADTAAGFHYFFALDGASLAGVTYANAGTSDSQSYAFTDGLSAHIVTARILAIDGNYTDYAASIQVNSVSPTATLVAPTTVNEGSAFTVALTNPVDPSNPDANAGFHYAFALDNASLAGVTYANAGISASESYTFNDGLSSHTVTERIIAQDGDFTDYTAFIQLNSVPPTASLVAPSSVNAGSVFTVALTNPYDPSSLDTAAGFHYAFALDGASLAGVTYASAGTNPSQSLTLNNGLIANTVTARIMASDGDFTDYTESIKVNLAVSPATLPSATANSAYSSALSAIGGSGTYTFAVSAGSLPSWLTLNSGTGVLSGTPTTTGTSTFTITATDGNVSTLTGSQTYTLTVNPASSLTVSPGTLASGTAFGLYSATLSATGGSGTYSFAVSAGSLPTGLTLNASTGVLNGRPTASGTFNFTVTATDSNIASLTGSEAFTLTLVLPPTIILDDSAGTPTFSETGPYWAGTGDGTAWNGEEEYNAEAAVGAITATSQTNQVQPGVEYLVQADWNANSPGNCSAAQYFIYDGNTLVATVTADQAVSPVGSTINGVTFQTLTTIIPTTSTIKVIVTNDALGVLIADAVRITPPGQTPPTAQLSGPTVIAGSSNATVSFSNQQGGTAPYTYSYDFGNTGTFEIVNSSNATATIPGSYLATPGTLVVHGRILDSAGDYTDYTTNITINPAGPPPSAIVLDDSAGAPTFSETGPSWAGTGDGTAWNGEEDYNAQAAVGTATATWQTTQVQPGVEYLVQADWNANSSGDCSAAQYNIYDGNTLVTTVMANQALSPSGPTINGVTFQTLTTIVPTTDTISVTVTNEAGGTLIADAVRIAEPGETPPTAQLSGTSVNAGASNATVSFSNQQGGTAPYTYSYDFGNTGTFEILGSSNATVTIPESYVNTPGTLVVRGRITDSIGDYTDYTTNITVGPQGWIVTPYLSIPDFGSNPTIVSVQSGNWSNPATWSLDRIPIAGDIVNIDAGTTVTYDVNDTTDAAPLKTVEVANGATLTFSTTTNTQMNVVNLMMLQGGTLDIGTQANPIPANITATVVWVNQAINTTTDPEQYGNGLIALGTVNTYGAAKVPYVTLSQNANAGDTVLHLASPAIGWQVGDKLELPDTRQLNYNDMESNVPVEWESMTIQSISADGMTITLTAPLQYDHLGAYDANGNLDYLPQVVNMTRNVTIHSQSATGTRGYALFTDQANVNINYTNFGGMGRTTDAEFLNSNFNQLFDNTTFDASGNVTHVGTDEENRDAITFLDLIGPSSPQADGYQFTFNGNVVTCPLTPMPFIWGINVVNSYYGLIENNDVVNWAGSGVMVDDRSSYNNFTGNFVMRINGTGQRGGADLGFAGNGFWFGNSNNFVTNNIVSDLSTNGNGVYAYGFEFYAIFGQGENGDGNVSIAAYQGADPSQPGQSVTVDMNLVPLLQFANNEVYGNTPIGLAYWWINYDGDGGAGGLPSGGVIQNFVTWNVWGTGILPYQSNGITINGFVDIGDANEMNSGNGATGISFSDYFTGNLTLENANLQNQSLGISVPNSTAGTTTIQNCYLANNLDIYVGGLWEVSADAATIPPRDTVINNVQFVAPGAGQPFTAIYMNWYNAGELYTGPVNVIQLDQVFVYNYDDVSADNFQVFYTQQAASYIVPQSLTNSAGITCVLGAPVAGLTNAQAWAQYDIAIAGAVAPSDATTMNDVFGLVAII